MQYKYRISGPALQDIEEAYVWYEKEQPGLGESFLAAIDQAEKMITANPHTYRFWYEKKVRGYVLRRFPFLILYVIKSGCIDVLAVYHTRQHPDKWKKRID